MKFPRPQVHLINTLSDAFRVGCDTVMPRLDGWPVVINCIGDRCQVFTDFQFTEAQEHLFDVEYRSPITGLFVGARDRNADTVTIYDTWWLNGLSTQAFTFRERYLLAKVNLQKLDPRFRIVTVAPITNAELLWGQCAINGWKGLVFRRSKDTAAGELFALPYYVEAPQEFPR